jgi:hypothetical protein
MLRLRELASGALAVAIILLLVAPASADWWLTATPAGSAGLKDVVPADRVNVAAADRGGAGFAVSVSIPGFIYGTEKTAAGDFASLILPGEAIAGEVGQPAIPVIRRLFVAPEGTTPVASARVGNAFAVKPDELGIPVRLRPVQPPVEKIPGALENAPFEFDAAAYSVNRDYAPARATVRELGIVRGRRLFALEIWPVSFNAATQQLTFWMDLSVEVRFRGPARPASALSPLPGLHSLVLNPSQVPALSRRGGGNYLIIAAQTFETDIAAFATAKTAQGFTVTTHVVPPGTSSTTIKSYIQGLWGGADAPDYILLVGDTDTIPSWVGGGEGSPDTDLPYTCMDGPSDWYPDIALGRFPARNAAQLEAMVNKTLYYENGPLADPDYVKRSVWMASYDNHAVSEGTHDWVIATYIEPREIAYDKLYCYTYSATTQQVRDAFNDGRFFGIYSGHGSTDSWADGPAFSQSDVNNLTNADMYAFVCSFACLTGEYTLDECFAETWVRAANKGAAAMYASSVTSYWTEDDVLERRLFDSIYDEDDQVVAELGPVWNDTRMRYLGEMGSGQTTRRYFEMYNLMGDPALAFPGECSDAGTIQLDSTKYACQDTVAIRVTDCGLNLDPTETDTVTVNVASTSEPAGESVLLTETNPNSARFEGTIDVDTSDSPGVLLVADGGTITATYIDADDGLGHYDVVVAATATVDCTPPVISDIHASDVQARTATIAFTADEPARGIVHYGSDCEHLTQTAQGTGYSTTPTVGLSGLQPNTTYYYSVDAEDEAGNLTVDPGCYYFSTPDIPDFFTELFDGSHPNDLDNVSLLFTPDGSGDFYHGCATPITELPTDPAGGTALSLSDDSYANVTPGGTIYLYGTPYTNFYVGSNGYITFGSSDSTYTETLSDHFSKPRVAALFDDLDPGQGGTVSWRLLADGVAMTWLNVPEHNGSNQNTFQIELFFDGRIAISYLSIAATDGLAGLSQGLGLSPDYTPSDLSALGSCGPRPPTAVSGAVTTEVGAAVEITLQATDDGLPDPPATLTYTITSLPVHGMLTEPGIGAITSAPYTLAADNQVVVYQPVAFYGGSDSFTWKANDGGVPPEGGDSNIATVAITVGGPQVIYSFDMESDPGWSTQDQWAWGQPTGGGSYNHDPTAGHTGTHVYGYNLAGDYPNNMTVKYLTTAALDFTEVTQVQLKFWRWLGVESAQWDHAGMQVSNNGTTWATVWDHTEYSSISDAAWSQQSFDISAVADDQPTVYVRWGMGPTDTSVTYPGWNIDDVEFWGVVPVAAPSLGDLNCDGAINGYDIDPFVLALTDAAAYTEQFPGCDYMLADVNGDGSVNGYDIDPFVLLLTGG